ncbi:MAG: hypothetical protein A4E66_01620 [Syntrophus sp. PtaB.Bin001]|nr:MAG: hypothetical protein A4E66_01620 [Syntrophus sp. PtaB.Bin001]
MTLNAPRSASEERNHLQLTLKSSLIGKFSGILQRGFAFKARLGVSISSFLCDNLALSPKYVQERIATIFLDGKTVDSIETAFLREGAILALSSAMPGLAGATLRRDGPYASLRDSITYREGKVKNSIEEGLITIKLFNLLIEELGPLFLEKGIIVKSSELRDFLAEQRDEFRQGCGDILFDGEVLEYGTFLSGNRPAENEEVELTVVTG